MDSSTNSVIILNVNEEEVSNTGSVVITNRNKKNENFTPEFLSFFQKKPSPSKYSYLSLSELVTLLQGTDQKVDKFVEYQKRLQEDKHIILDILKQRRG